MDTLALGVIAIGVVAAIGVVLVAMNGNDSEAKAEASAAEAAKQQPEQPRARPRPRRRQQAVSKYVAPAPQPNGYTAGPQDPLVAGFMQVVSSELQTLRQQQERIDQRLKLINGIAELMHDMQPSSANGAAQVSQNSNHRTAA
jgi:hypothetical protein